MGTAVMHNTARKSSKDVPCYRSDSHHCSDVVYCGRERKTEQQLQQSVSVSTPAVNDSGVYSERQHRASQNAHHTKPHSAAFHHFSHFVVAKRTHGNCLAVPFYNTAKADRTEMQLVSQY